MEKVQVEFQKMYYGFPVILVSYYEQDGTPNVATMSSSFSLGRTICLGFGGGGHAIRVIREARQFAVNVPDRQLMQPIEVCGYTSGSEYQKFALSGLTPVRSDVIDAPTIAECPLSLECQVLDVYEHAGYVFVVAEVVGYKVAQELLDAEGQLQNERLDPVLFLGDGQERVYRFLQQDLVGKKGAYLPEKRHVNWR